MHEAPPPRAPAASPDPGDEAGRWVHESAPDHERGDTAFGAAAAGAVVGQVAGAALGGPPGAVAGGVVGATVGGVVGRGRRRRPGASRARSRSIAARHSTGAAERKDSPR